MVIVASVPAGLVGVGIKALGLDGVLENIFVVAMMLIVTAGLMFGIDRLPRGRLTEKDAPLVKTSLLVGGLQALAILPGLSRSGSTIFGGVVGGLKKDFAVRFAFILSIPAILGAGLIEGLHVVGDGNIVINPVNWLVGFVAATICGVISIKFVKLLIRNDRFYVFGIYCLLAAVFALLVGLGAIPSVGW
jgi:undecaprenyl-diphosphatase